MGFIGVGGMGSGHLEAFLGKEEVRVAAVCDVRESHRQKAKEQVDEKYQDSNCAVYADFRELLARPDIDAVLIAVPDHWHVLIGIEAARQGKHMYFEKPVGRTVAEAKALREAVKRAGVVFQFGTQQRSSFSYRHTVELVRSGKIGELQKIMIGSALPSYLPFQPEQPVPAGFDYNFWLGPAPWAPYTFERCTRNWTLIYDYSLGCVSGAWGIHDVDIAQWALDADQAGPVEVEGAGMFPDEGIYDTATSWEVEHLYPNGVRLIHMDMNTAKKRAPQFSLAWMGSLFQGSEGWIYVSRQGFFARPASLLQLTIRPNEIRVPRSNDHRKNFLDSVRKGSATISPIDAAVRCDAVCHQADIAMRLERRLRWDLAKEEFVGDPEANRMLSRSMRSPWSL
jgi:predicted dehydrogenase